MVQIKPKGLRATLSLIVLLLPLVYAPPASAEQPSVDSLHTLKTYGAVSQGGLQLGAQYSPFKIFAAGEFMGDVKVKYASANDYFDLQLRVGALLGARFLSSTRSTTLGFFSGFEFYLDNILATKSPTIQVGGKIAMGVASRGLVCKKSGGCRVHPGASSVFAAVGVQLIYIDLPSRTYFGGSGGKAIVAAYLETQGQVRLGKYFGLYGRIEALIGGGNTGLEFQAGLQVTPWSKAKIRAGISGVLISVPETGGGRQLGDDELAVTFDEPLKVWPMISWAVIF